MGISSIYIAMVIIGLSFASALAARETLVVVREVALLMPRVARREHHNVIVAITIGPSTGTGTGTGTGIGIGMGIMQRSEGLADSSCGRVDVSVAVVLEHRQEQMLRFVPAAALFMALVVAARWVCDRS